MDNRLMAAALPMTLILFQYFCVNVFIIHIMDVLWQIRNSSWAHRCSLFAMLQCETTLHQHCGAVTKSMSNCIGLQLYSSEHLSLSGLLWNHTQARAHTHEHRNTHTRWINTKHGQSKRYGYMHRQGEVEKPCIYLERFVVGSLITIHSLISPNLLK